MSGADKQKQGRKAWAALDQQQKEEVVHLWPTASAAPGYVCEFAQTLHSDLVKAGSYKVKARGALLTWHLSDKVLDVSAVPNQEGFQCRHGRRATAEPTARAGALGEAARARPGVQQSLRGRRCGTLPRTVSNHLDTAGRRAAALSLLPEVQQCFPAAQRSAAVLLPTDCPTRELHSRGHDNRSYPVPVLGRLFLLCRPQQDRSALGCI